MSPEMGSLLLLLLFCAGATAVNPLTTADPNKDKEASGTLILQEKPGRCPANVDYPVNGSTVKKECKRDKDCEMKLKCCFSAGRRRCLLPLDAKDNACPYFNVSKCMHVKPSPFECHSDDQCQGTERCCYYECRLQCMPTVKVKSGSCPIPVTRCASPPPPPKCKSDSECPKKQKCCTRLCGLECTDPVPSVKSGTCPAPVTLCAISPSSPRPKPLCMSDDDCLGKQKCCMPKCRQECTDPLPTVKSGTCPAPVTLCAISPSSPRPKPLCMSDDDCLGKQKCCTPKCRQECTDPLPSVKSGTCPASVISCRISPSSMPPKPLCMSDGDCLGKQKCCTPKCRQECTDPLPSVKSGTCPASVISCRISPSSTPPKPLCMSDGDCLGKQKCCTPKCRRECTDPLPSKPGSCPTAFTKCHFPTPPSECADDNDCSGKKKCCNLRCYQECADPTPMTRVP